MLFFSVANAGYEKNFKNINFDDGTSQSTVGGGGYSIFPASSTAILPFGSLSSTGTYTSSVTISALAVGTTNFNINSRDVVTIAGSVGVYSTVLTTPTCNCGTNCSVWGTDHKGIVVFGSPVASTCKVIFHDVHFSTQSCTWTYHAASSAPWYSVDTPIDSTFTLQGPDTLNGTFVSYDCDDVRFR